MKDKLQVIMKIDSFMGLKLPDSPLTLSRFEDECRGHANFNITRANGENDYVTETQVTNTYPMQKISKNKSQ